MRQQLKAAAPCISKLRGVVSSLNRYTSEVYRVLDLGDDASNDDLSRVINSLSTARSGLQLFEGTTKGVVGFVESNPLMTRADASIEAAENSEANLPEFTYLTAVPPLMKRIMDGLKALYAEMETTEEELEDAWAPLLDGDIFEGIEDYSIDSVSDLKEWFKKVEADLKALARGR